MGHYVESATGTTVWGLLNDPKNREAWERFETRYAPKIYRWCRRWNLQKVDAQDITQDILLKLLDGIRTYDRNKGPFRPWLKTVTHHAWQDFVERRRRAGWGSGDPAVERLLGDVAQANGLAETLDEEYYRELLEQGMAIVRLRVQPHTWDAFWLLAVEGLSAAEVAPKLNISITASWKARSRVQRMLKQEIAKLDGCRSD